MKAKVIYEEDLRKVLKANGIEFSEKEIERLVMVRCQDAKALVKEFGNGKADVELIKKGVTDTYKESLDNILRQLYENVPEFHVRDQKQLYKGDGASYVAK